ncbi:MAG: glycosyltransferase family 2 protein [Gemmatimonadaceae bacterium]
MLYICIPTHNEAPTIGLLLWRIRKVFQGYSREYEIVVYDDASTDGTSEVLSPYAEVAPLTVIRGETRVGYGKAVEILMREASRRTKYPRRDGMILMQGDFTDQPESLPELVKRFEGGADIVLATRGVAGEPAEVRRLRRLAPWALRFSLGIEGVADPCASFRLFRISLLRDFIKSMGEKPLLSSDGWSANVELLMNTVPLARRVETVALESRYDLRVRPSRIRPFADAMAIFRFGRSVKGRRIALPAPAALSARPAPAGGGAQRHQATT